MPVIKLNVGGTVFHTTTGTLLNYGDDTFFTRMFGFCGGEVDVGKVKAEKIDGAIFIDRDPAPFKVLLSAMRDFEPIVCPTSTVSVRSLEKEITFYQLPTTVQLEPPLTEDEKFEKRTGLPARFRDEFNSVGARGILHLDDPQFIRIVSPALIQLLIKMCPMWIYSKDKLEMRPRSSVTILDNTYVWPQAWFILGDVKNVMARLGYSCTIRKDVKYDDEWCMVNDGMRAFSCSTRTVVEFRAGGAIPRIESLDSFIPCPPVDITHKVRQRAPPQ